MRVLLDSFAWLVYFKKEKGGEKVLSLIEDKTNELFTTSANLYEVYYRTIEDEGREKLLQTLLFIKNNSRVISVDSSIAEEAAEARLKYGLPAIDAFTYAAAKRLNAKVITGDKDFVKLENVIFL